MAGTYGKPGKNTFAVPGVGGILSPVVNPDTKITQVYRGAAGNTFQSLGTFNSNTKKFTPDASANLPQAEIRSLSSERGIKEISDAGSAATILGVQAAGGSADAAKAASNKIFSPNKANTPETEGFNSANFISQIGSDDRTRDNFNNFTRPLIYPNDIANTKQDIIKFDMLKYKPKKFDSEKFGFGERERNFTNDSIGTVILPIPSGISDVSSVQWGAEPLNAAEAELARVALSGITEGGAGFVGSVEAAAKKVSESSGAVKTAVAAALAGQAVGVRGLLTKTTGAIINPNLELLFNAPTLRPFNFTFKMSARNEDEAQTIIDIIRFFRQGMAPQRSKSNLFLKSPHTFKIRYMHRGQKGQEHKYIGKIKECALQNFTVNYTPEGQYATFYDGVLVSYEMSMSFTELEPVFNEDNDKEYGQIGF